ncbi:uncharacterized protein LOC113216407 [Frankliniella occidentalis]|uniref:Uncharacterized protein LOC113216407 n=1 Tax=Frankliniella occidentalis TaxID=133901 RepID=A0A9C6XCR5_FRAOC|nr:uncharacterized protein LOC113216407 [Frankliniella occidentalis]
MGSALEPLSPDLLSDSTIFHVSRARRSSTGDLAAFLAAAPYCKACTPNTCVSYVILYLGVKISWGYHDSVLRGHRHRRHQLPLRGCLESFFEVEIPENSPVAGYNLLVFRQRHEAHDKPMQV